MGEMVRRIIGDSAGALADRGGGGGGGRGADSGSPLGYVRVATFSKQTPDGVRDAIKALKVGALAGGQLI